MFFLFFCFYLCSHSISINFDKKHFDLHCFEIQRINNPFFEVNTLINYFEYHKICHNNKKIHKHTRQFVRNRKKKTTRDFYWPQERMKFVCFAWWWWAQSNCTRATRTFLNEWMNDGDCFVESKINAKFKMPTNIFLIFFLLYFLFMIKFRRCECTYTSANPED